jgi:hypothetical protein
MDLPADQTRLLVGAYLLSEGDHQRQLRARALIQHIDFGRDDTDWIFEAIEGLTDLGLLMPFSRDGTIEVQPIQLTSGGAIEAQRLLERGVQVPMRQGSHAPTRYYEVPLGWPSDIPPDDELEIPPPTSGSTPASSWTGRSSISEQVRTVTALAPLAMRDIDMLIDTTREKRFNDGATADAIDRLRDLHSALGDLLKSVEANAPLDSALTLLRRHRDEFLECLKQGAKVAIAAPALTLGVVHILSKISGIPADSQLLATVYAAMVGGDALRQMGWRSRS